MPATATPSKVPATATPGGILPPAQLGALRDAWTDEANPTQNRGSDVVETVYPVTNKRHRSFLQFDLSQFPATACVSSATLTLTLTNVGAASVNYGMYRVTQSWTEGNSTDLSGVTWLKRDGVSSWTAPGGDAASTATAVSATGVVAGVQVQWNVTSDVAAFIAGTATNYGWMLRDTNEGTGSQFRFGSREATSSSSRPQLQITFGPCA